MLKTLKEFINESKYLHIDKNFTVPKTLNDCKKLVKEIDEFLDENNSDEKVSVKQNTDKSFTFTLDDKKVIVNSNDKLFLEIKFYEDGDESEILVFRKDGKFK